MTFKILFEENNKLIGRKEVRGRVTYTGATPDRNALSKEFKGKNVIIRRIKPEFGSSSAIVEAVIYENEEIMNKLEAKHYINKNAKKPKEEEKSAEEAPAETSEEKGDE